MNYNIIGEPFPAVVCTLNADESMITERGSMCWMSPNMKMETTSNGGIGKVFGRMFSGEAMFQNRYTAEPGTDSPAGTDAPDSEKPTEAGSGQIADFREGKVVKPEDVPEIRSAVEKEYPGYTIQSVTHALLSDRQAYKVTLQGSGDLAKVIYMLADGTIVVPKMQD